MGLPTHKERAQEHSKQWAQFFNRSYERRISERDFDTLSQALRQRSSMPGSKIAQSFVEATAKCTAYTDPKIIAYLDILIDRTVIDVADVWFALYKRTSGTPKASSPEAWQEVQNQPHLEIKLLAYLLQSFLNGQRISSQAEARKCIFCAMKYMSVVDAKTRHAGPADQMAQHDLALLRDVIGQVVTAALEHPTIAKVARIALDVSLKKPVVTSLASFVPLWAQINPELAARLEATRKQLGLVDEAGGESFQSDGIDAALRISSVLEVPMVHARAHLYILVTSVCQGRPLTDEGMLLSYLDVLYQGDVQTMVADLIAGTFDALLGAKERGEPEHVLFAMKSFLVNKIPPIINALANPLISALNLEYSITQALAQINQVAFPTFSDSFLGQASPLSEVKQDFVFACVRHGLLQVALVEGLLGDGLMDTVPGPASRLVKEDIVAKCLVSLDKMEGFIGELDKLDGNAGAISLAITQLIVTFAANGETMSLQRLCSALSRKPRSMDVILQFTSPVTILQLLCNLLDGWRYDEDQGEYQPVYDEFAAILLLVLAFVHRYDLDINELGIPRTSFVARLLQKGHQSRPYLDLSEEERKYVDGWIAGLFNPDGITDEVMANCRPQDFYLLTPTIVSQAVAACAAGVLDLKTVKHGLDYLQLTFLMPALVSSISWLCNHAWCQTSDDVPTVLALFKQMVKPPNSGEAARAMHATVVQIVRQDLLRHLKVLEKRVAAKSAADINEIRLAIQSVPELQIDSLEPSNGPSVDGLLSAKGSCVKAVKNSTAALISWSIQAAQSAILGGGLDTTLSPPTAYSPRLLQVAMRFSSPFEVIAAIVEEVKMHTNSAAIALDVATGLICAPTAKNSPLLLTWSTSTIPTTGYAKNKFNLKDALNVMFADVAKLLKDDAAAGETVVRLHRRTEALCIAVANVVSHAAQVDAAAAMAAAVVDAAVAGNVDLAAAAAVTDGQVSAEQMQQLSEQMALDVSSAVEPLGDPLAELLGKTAGISRTTSDADEIFKLAQGNANMATDLTMDDIMEGMATADANDDIFADLDFGEEFNLE